MIAKRVLGMRPQAGRLRERRAKRVNLTCGPQAGRLRERWDYFFHNLNKVTF